MLHMIMKKRPYLGRPLLYLLKDIYSLRRLSHFVLINGSGIYYFIIGRKTQKLIVGVSGLQSRGMKDCLHDFAGRIAASRHYYGQPLTILIGGPKCFYRVEPVTDQKPPSSRIFFNAINPDKVLIRFRYLTDGRGIKFIFISGIQNDLRHVIIDEFKRNGIPVAGFIPASYLTLANLIIRRLSFHVAVKLPGEILYLSRSNREIIIFEKSSEDFQTLETWHHPVDALYSYLQRDVESSNNKAYPLYYLIMPPGQSLDAAKGFFGSSGSHGRRGAEIHWLNYIHTATRWLSLLSLTLMVAMIALGIYSSEHSNLIKAHDADFVSKKELEKKIALLEEKLAVRRSEGYLTSLAGAISAFCRKYPPELYLKSIAVSKNETGIWGITAAGVSNTEDRVFEYRRQIAENTPDFPVEVVFLRQPEYHSGELYPGKNHSFDFKIRLLLQEIR